MPLYSMDLMISKTKWVSIDVEAADEADAKNWAERYSGPNIAGHDPAWSVDTAVYACERLTPRDPQVLTPAQRATP